MRVPGLGVGVYGLSHIGSTQGLGVSWVSASGAFGIRVSSEVLSLELLFRAPETAAESPELRQGCGTQAGLI